MQLYVLHRSSWRAELLQQSELVLLSVDWGREVMTRPKLETVANFAMIITSVIASTVLVMQWRAPRTPPAAPQPFVVGEHIDQVGQDAYAGAAHTLIMYVRSTCHCCTESMPFYQSLSRGHREGQNTRLVAVTVSAEPESVLREYLHSHDVAVDRIVTAPVVVPTPTLVLVDGVGVVQRVWVGKQAAPGEQEILNALR
jgi:hypothetical protein